LGSLGVLFSIIIFATKLVLQKRDLTTDAHLSSLAKGRDRAIEETIIQSGLNDTISEIDADIDIKTPLPLPSVFKNEVGTIE